MSHLTSDHSHCWFVKKLNRLVMVVFYLESVERSIITLEDALHYHRLSDGIQHKTV